EAKAVGAASSDVARLKRLAREAQALAEGLFELEQALGEGWPPAQALRARLGEARAAAGEAARVLDGAHPEAGARTQEQLARVVEIAAAARAALAGEGAVG